MIEPKVGLKIKHPFYGNGVVVQVGEAVRCGYDVTVDFETRVIDRVYATHSAGGSCNNTGRWFLYEDRDKNIDWRQCKLRSKLIREL